MDFYCYAIKKTHLVMMKGFLNYLTIFHQKVPIMKILLKQRNKFQSFITKKDGYTIATIYYFAIEDNKPRFVEIIKQTHLI